MIVWALMKRDKQVILMNKDVKQMWKVWKDLFEDGSKFFYIALLVIAAFFFYLAIVQLQEWIMLVIGGWLFDYPYVPVARINYNEDTVTYYTALQYVLAKQNNFLIAAVIGVFCLGLGYASTKGYLTSLRTTAKAWIYLEKCIDRQRAFDLFMNGEKDAYKIIYRSDKYTNRVKEHYSLESKSLGRPVRCFATMMDGIGWDGINGETVNRDIDGDYPEAGDKEWLEDKNKDHVLIGDRGKRADTKFDKKGRPETTIVPEVKDD